MVYLANTQREIKIRERGQNMNRDDILKKVAPCSLMCHTCSACADGVIRRSSETLLRYLDGIKDFYRKHIPDAVDSYSNFEGVLAMYSGGPCPGCRAGEHNGCSIAGCFLPECTKEHGVDFCGECREFPCQKTKDLFEEDVYGQWLQGGREIRDNGIEAFWESHSEDPHYRPYKK